MIVCSSERWPFIWLILSTINLIACSQTADLHNLPYNFDQADASYKLDKDLDEISGLVNLDDERIAAINDEQGNIYVLSVANGEILDKIDFGKKADYEAISKIDEQFYVLATNGKLHVFNPNSTDEELVQIFDLQTSRGTEMEGLCYDEEHECLLTTFKSRTENEAGSERAIYRIKTGRNYKLDKKPIVSWDNEALLDYLKRNDRSDLKKLIAGHLFGQAAFQPSGLAIHPITGEYYLVSAVNELILVIDPITKSITGLTRITSEHQPQPEGISFLSDGSLVIASENGGSGKARLEIYRMK